MQLVLFVCFVVRLEGGKGVKGEKVWDSWLHVNT